MKKIILFILLVSLISSCLVSKSKTKSSSKDTIVVENRKSDSLDKIIIDELEQTIDSTIYKTAEKQPEYPGGEQEMYKYLARTFKYTKTSLEIGVQGKVYVSFIIEKNGAISTVKVIRGIGIECDKEAENAVKNMPKWTPGEIKGQTVRVILVLPINFI